MNFCLISLERPERRAIVEVGRQDRQIVAAVAGDILGLAIEINRVFGVGFEPAHKVSGNIGKLRPDTGKNSERELGLRRELEGRAASAVAIDDKAVRLELARRGGRGVEHRPRLPQLVAELGIGSRPLRPTQPSAMPLAVSRSSALSALSDSRNSAREVNMR